MTLRKHFEKELTLAGWVEEDPENMAKFLQIAEIWESMGHSGGSHMFAAEILQKLINFKPLQPITDDPEEWNHLDPILLPTDSLPTWQNKRDSSIFSQDHGLTYYNVDTPETLFFSAKKLDSGVIFEFPGGFWALIDKITSWGSKTEIRSLELVTRDDIQILSFGGAPTLWTVQFRVTRPELVMDDSVFFEVAYDEDSGEMASRTLSEDEVVL